MLTWSTTATRRPQGTRGTRGRLQGLANTHEERRLGTNQLVGRVSSRQICSTGTWIASEAWSDAWNNANWEHANRDMLCLAMDETNTIRVAIACLSYTKNACIPAPHSYWDHQPLATRHEWAWLRGKLALERAFTIRLIITLGLLCMAMNENNTVRLARACRSYTIYKRNANPGPLRWCI